MLSYQHSYHAGNLADVHKHRVLAQTLNALVEDAAPLLYIETHAGRGVYDLRSKEAKKTSEAEEGQEALAALPLEHTYRRCIAQTQERYGKNFYPGSPQIARLLLRPNDTLHLHELHPQEYAALTACIKAKNIRMYKKDGYAGALALAAAASNPRAMVLIDPSYEVKEEYQQVVEFILRLKEKWAQAQLLLWYPLLEAGLHEAMTQKLLLAFTGSSKDENLFPATSRLRMKGSGMWSCA